MNKVLNNALVCPLCDSNVFTYLGILEKGIVQPKEIDYPTFGVNFVGLYKSLPNNLFGLEEGNLVSKCKCSLLITSVNLDVKKRPSYYMELLQTQKRRILEC